VPLLLTAVLVSIRLLLSTMQPGVMPLNQRLAPTILACPACGRLVGLRSLVLAAGFFQEISGLPASLTSLRLDRNVVYVRLLGAPHPAVVCAGRRDELSVEQLSTPSCCSRGWW
jgi:hypothetical protein